MPGPQYGLQTLSTTRKPPFLTKFGLRLQVQASGFELMNPILEAARSNHWAIHYPHVFGESPGIVEP